MSGEKLIFIPGIGINTIIPFSGVIDDRGKFIYISEEEMQSVAK